MSRENSSDVNSGRQQSNPPKNVQVISRFRECRRFMQTIRTHCDEYNVIGFDCEWVSYGKDRHPIALLQLESHRGYCALIRLCHLRKVPREVREILEDRTIIKVGVDPKRDAAYLLEDYGVNVSSTLDLRFLAEAVDCTPGGLAKMAENYLNVAANKKNFRIHFLWEKPNLTQEQIAYAAMDAHIGIELFKFFGQKLQSKCQEETLELQQMIDGYCVKHFGMTYIDKNNGNSNSNLNDNSNKVDSNRMKKPRKKKHSAKRRKQKNN